LDLNANNLSDGTGLYELAGDLMSRCITHLEKDADGQFSFLCQGDQRIYFLQ
jgi:hypothetical protein